MKWILLAVLIGLSGCADQMARAIHDANYIQDQTENYVRERHVLRQEIRQRCQEILWKQVDQLIAGGDYEGAKTLLALSYPDLVTIDMLKKLVKSAETGNAAAFHDLAPGCSVQELPSETVIE